MASQTPRVKKSAYNKLAKRDAYPDMSELGKADNLLRQMRYGHDYDPLTELITLAKNSKTTQAEKIRIATELLSYTAPKMRAIQTNPDMGEVININITHPGVTEDVKIIDIEPVAA